MQYHKFEEELGSAWAVAKRQQNIYKEQLPLWKIRWGVTSTSLSKKVFAPTYCSTFRVRTKTDGLQSPISVNSKPASDELVNTFDCP